MLFYGKKTKVCIRCHAKKPFTPEFWVKSYYTKSGLGSYCLECKEKEHQEKMRAYREREEERRKKKWGSDAEEKKKIRNDFYASISHLNGKERKRAVNRWHGKKSASKRYHHDPVWRLRQKAVRAMRRVLQGKQKTSKYLSTLPYTGRELQEHIASQFDANMTWENYGTYWELDHIKPQSLLPYESIEDENYKECWALSNLQPLTYEENRKKSDEWGL